MTHGLNDSILWALSDDAQVAVGTMMNAGIDRDLAISVLELLWDETEIYAIPSDDEDVAL